MKKRLDPNRPRRWEAVIRRIPEYKPWFMAEVGVWMGATAGKVLAARQNVHYVAIDAWQKPAPDSLYATSPDTIAKQDQAYFDDCYAKACKVMRPYSSRRHIIRMWSEDAVRLYADGTFDMVFIDAEHTYEGVKADIERWLPKVRKGGVISGHDYGNLPRFPGVAKAVDEAFGTDIELDGDCTWFHWI